jgi:TolA-binding protein
MTATQWRPDDTELDAVARTLETSEPTDARAEQIRTSVLASAAAQPQRSRRNVAPFAVAGLALAAAAAVVLWIATRVDAPVVAMGPKQMITPIGSARFERASDWPDYVVHLDDGRIDVQVAALAVDERFRVATLDAEVEVRGTRFEVGAERDRLMTVLVTAGRAEVRVKDQQVVVLSAGESWSATKTAQRDEIIAPVPVPSPEPPPPIDHPGAPPTSTSGAKADHVATTAPARPEVPAPSTDKPTPAPTPASNPGEAEFRAGWAALRAGDAGAAAKAFSTACSEAAHAALGEDACFWAGAAAKRAGDPTMARGALAQFLERFPSSSRAAEASALLGWLLYDAGELDAAERLFHQAERDRVPKVRESAQRGLTAIQRKRHTP